MPGPVTPLRPDQLTVGVPAVGNWIMFTPTGGPSYRVEFSAFAAGIIAVGGAGVGSVTSVGLSLPASLFNVTGSPVTSTGTLTAGFVDQNANLIFAGPSSGAAAAPTFRSLVAGDIPGTLSITALSNLTSNGFIKTSGGTGTLSVDTSVYLTGNQTITLSGNVTGSGTTAITTTIANGVVTNAMLAGSIDLTTKVTGALPIANGGTGQTAKTAAYNALTPLTTLGDAVYHDGTNAVRLAGNITATKKFLTQTGNGTVSAAPGWNTLVAGDIPGTLSITAISNLTSNGFIKTSGGTGTLSVDTSTYLTGNQTITLSGDVSGSGTTAITTTIGASKVTNAMLAGSIDLTTKVTGALPITNGGTGQTAKTAAFNALTPSTTLGDINYHDGTNAVRLAGNITATKKFLTQTGNGTVSAAPGWNTLVAGDIPGTLSITAISNLTSNGFIKTSGGTGTLSVDTSTYLTGNQTITLSGDVSGSGTTAITTTIGASKVTNAMLAGSIDLTTKVTGALPIANGGTGQTAKTAAFNALTPSTTLGDVNYHDGTNAVRLAGNITATKKFLTQTGNGTVSAAPGWNTLVAGDIPGTLSITAISNLTSNGFVKTSGGTGALSIDTSTYLTGNQTITLSGDISGSGTTAITTTIGASKVTNAMLAGSIDLTTKVTGALPIANGGTGQTAKTAAYNALTPMTTLGDIPYHDGTNGLRLAGNTTVTKKFLTQTGNGTVSAAPGWNTISLADLTASAFPDPSGNSGKVLVSNGSTMSWTNTTGYLNIQPAAVTSTNNTPPTTLQIVLPAHTSVDAQNNQTDLYIYSAGALQFSTTFASTIASQSTYTFQGRSYSAAASLTMTEGQTFYIIGAPYNAGNVSMGRQTVLRLGMTSPNDEGLRITAFNNGAPPAYTGNLITCESYTGYSGTRYQSLVVDSVGRLLLKGAPSTTTDLRFYEATNNGTNYVGFKAPTSIATDVNWILPNADGAANSLLKTDGAGNLSWLTPAGIIAANLAGGTTGSIPYQSALDTTTMLPIGASGTVLAVHVSGVPYWTAASSLTTGGSTNTYITQDYTSVTDMPITFTVNSFNAYNGLRADGYYTYCPASRLIKTGHINLAQLAPGGGASVPIPMLDLTPVTAFNTSSSSEFNNIYVRAPGVTYTSTPPSTWRHIRIDKPSLSMSADLTVTKAATVSIEGAPAYPYPRATFTYGTITHSSALAIKTGFQDGHAIHITTYQDLQVQDVLLVEDEYGDMKFKLDKIGRPVFGGDAPTISGGTGAGTGSAVTIAGSDVRGVISLTTGSSPATSATVFTLTFSKAYTAAPKMVILQAENDLAQALTGAGAVRAYSSDITTTTFVAKIGTPALAASQTYKWTYLVIG